MWFPRPIFLQNCCRIMREVPGVKGVKQSAGDLKLMADLLEISQSEDLIFSAVDTLLYPSFILKAGERLLQFLPRFRTLCRTLGLCYKGDHERALELHSQLWLLECLYLENLPACVKYAQTLQGLPETFSEDRCLKRDRKRVFGSIRRFRMLESELIGHSFGS